MQAVSQILVPVDFSPCAQRALEVATSTARDFGASLLLLYVVDLQLEPYPGIPFLPVADLAAERIESAEHYLDELLAGLPAGLVATREVRCGVPALEIVDAAKARRVDLIVMGTGGRTGLGRLMLGSVAERVVRTSRVPVLTVHAEPHRPPAAPALAG